MATPSAKHLSFVATPLQDTKLKDLPGIGETYEKKLREANINNPKMLMGQYLVQAGWHASGGDVHSIDASQSCNALLTSFFPGGRCLIATTTRWLTGSQR